MGDSGSPVTRPPPHAPNPGSDNAVKPQDTSGSGQLNDKPLVLRDENWDITSISALSAVTMLIEAVQTLADIIGNIPPTPPISRPTTPKSKSVLLEMTPRNTSDGMPMSPASPESPLATSHHPVPSLSMPSPEAHRHEPIPPIDVGGDAEDIAVQRAAIARCFYLKTVPPFSLSEYLMRLHKYCPHSPGVYLAAAAYVHRLCVAESIVPATSKTIHRLTLTAIRIASKALEDNKWSQDWYSKVGGVTRRELKSLEINLCYLLDFELFVREEELRKRMFLLQQAARQGQSVKKRLSDGFRMQLPTRQKQGSAGEG